MNLLFDIHRFVQILLSKTVNESVRVASEDGKQLEKKKSFVMLIRLLFPLVSLSVGTL